MKNRTIGRAKVPGRLCEKCEKVSKVMTVLQGKRFCSFCAASLQAVPANVSLSEIIG